MVESILTTIESDDGDHFAHTEVKHHYAQKNYAEREYIEKGYAGEDFVENGFAGEDYDEEEYAEDG